MKPAVTNRFRTLAGLALPVIFLNLAGHATAAELYWDGTAANIATDGDGIATFVAGTWSTSVANWDQGPALAHVAWNNANPDSPVFSGPGAPGAGTGNTGTARVVTLGSTMSVNQFKILYHGAGLNDTYSIGVTPVSNLYTISFGGTYSDTHPAIDASGGKNNTWYAKTTGTINGGLVIAHGSNITTPGASGRLYIANPANDFTGDITVLSGNLHVQSDGNSTATPTALATNLGNAANKVILKGGALFASNGAAITQTFNRTLEVAAASGIANNAATAGLQVMQFKGPISGPGNLTRYASITGSASSEVRLQSDLSGYTGLFENTGGILTVQATATSGGSWKISGGSIKLDAANNDAIASGAGKNDLLMNGGTLNLNGKAETINGLSGATGFVQNQLTATTGTLTLGDGDASATFGGDVGGGAGTLALTKIGSGTQTISGKCSYAGATTVNAGKLVVPNRFGDVLPTVADSAVTVAAGATFGVKVTVAGTSAALAGLTTGTTAGSTIALDLAGFGTSVDPFIVTDTFTPGTGATTVLRLQGYGFVPGTLPLIKYTTLGGAGFSGLGKQLPYRVVGNLVDNTALSQIDLNITSAESAIWSGQASSDWDIDPDATGTAGTENWKTSVGGVPTRYAQGANNTDQVTFDDRAVTSQVNLTTTLTPLHVLVNNPVTKPYTFAGAGKLSGETALLKDGEGTLILANPSGYDFTGGTTVALGTLQLGDGTTPGLGRLGGSILTDSSAARVVLHFPENLTLSNVFAGSGEVVKKGLNAVTLNAASTFSGLFTISTGTVVAASNAAMGAGTVYLGDAGTGSNPLELVLSNRVDVPASINVTADGTGSATLSASNTGTGTTNPASFTGVITLERPTTFLNDIVGDRLAFTGAIGGNVGTLTITGGQVMSFQSAVSDFTGKVAVTGAGTVLQAGVGSGSEFIPNTAEVELGAGTFLKLNGAGTTNETIGALSGSGTVQRALSGLQTLIVGTGDVSSTFAGVLTTGPGALALTKVGTGTLTLSGANIQTGTTTVSGGSLLVNGSITSLAMVSGGTLGGTGTVAAISVSGIGKVSPATDATIGTLTAAGNVAFVAGTEFVAQLNSDGVAAADKLAVTGTLALGGTFLTPSDLGSTTLSATTKLVLATATGAISGTFDGLANHAEVKIGANTYKIAYDDLVGPLNAVTLTFTGATVSGYSTWATTNGVGAADEDFDRDGVKNGVEYVLGSDPKVVTTAGITTAASATDFTFSFTRSDASETPDTTVTLETSNDLLTWTADGSPYAVGATSSGSVTVIENPAAPAPANTDTVTLTVPRNTPTKFARLNVKVAP